MKCMSFKLVDHHTVTTDFFLWLEENKKGKNNQRLPEIGQTKWNI